MFAIVDIAVLLLVLGLIRTGWKRGFVFIVLDLIGFGVAVALTVRFFPSLADLYRRIGAPDGWANIAAAVTVFGPAIAIVAVVGMRLSRYTWLPGLHLVNRVLGVAAGAALAAAIAIVALLALQLAPVPTFVTDPIGRSTAARIVSTGAPPALRALEFVSGDRSDAYLIHLRWAVAWAGSEPPPDPVTFGATVRGTHAPEVSDDVLQRLNDARVADGERRLRTDTDLVAAARALASRAGPDGALASDITGTRPHIVTLAPTARLAHDGVMRARMLRDIVLSENATRIGVGAYDTPKGLVVALVSCVGC